MVSTTLIVKLPLAVLLRLLVAEQLTVVAPKAKMDAEAGAQSTGIAPSLESFAVAMKLTVAPAGLAASAVISAGKVRTGGGVGSGKLK